MRKVICIDENLCTGCTACMNICPVNCIAMKSDSEGFLYPEVDEDKCVSCKLCENVCPVNHFPQKYPVLKGYIGRNRNIEIVHNSTSGGVASAIAQYVFNINGIMCGVGYDKEMNVIHFLAGKDETSKIASMRGSKYVQSELGYTFTEIQNFLRTGFYVGFIGTPCQVAGLKSFLKRDYDNLLTVDIVCHGVSSPLVFKEYIEYLEEKYCSSVIDVHFRNKTYGYHSSTMKVSFENGKDYFGSGRIDYMLKAYFSGACSRKVCYQCPFKGMERPSDLTIFDSWNVEKLNSNVKDDDCGFTNIFIHTQKGVHAVGKMTSYLQLWEALPEKMLKYDGIMINEQPKMADCRNDLFTEISNGTFALSMEKYFHISKKDYLFEYIKRFLYKLKIMQLIKQKRS